MHSRYDCRDAAHALMAAVATDEELVGPVPPSFKRHEGVDALTADMLRVFRTCGQAWIEGRSARPGQGLEEAEDELTADEEEEEEEEDREEAAGGAEDSEWETDDGEA